MYSRHKSHFCHVFCLLDSIWLILFSVDIFILSRKPISICLLVMWVHFSANSFFRFHYFWRILSLCQLLLILDVLKENNLFSQFQQFLRCYVIWSCRPLSSLNNSKNLPMVSVRWCFTFYFIKFVFHIWWAAFCCCFQVTCPFFASSLHYRFWKFTSERRF